MNKLFIKQKQRRKDEFQFFMHDFIDACIEFGIQTKPDIFPSYKWHIRSLIKRCWLFTYRILHGLRFVSKIRRKKKLIVAANGGTIADNLFPYYIGYEVVPMLWDCWPGHWKRMLRDFKLFDVHTALVTSRQVTEMINKNCKVHAVYIPEGIKASEYSKGKPLQSRTIDVMDMGRRMQVYHDMLTKMSYSGNIGRIVVSNIHKNGNLDDKHVAFTNEELHSMMGDSKIMVCFPRCDTNPQTAGNIETLTQRYWEAMLSRCVMIGRAPQELIDLIGYNPVIDVDWNNASKQLLDILKNISSYQQMVDYNYDAAQQHADWSHRMEAIKTAVRFKQHV